MLAMLLLGGAAIALFLVHGVENINRQGGWGWLLVGAIYVVAITVVCSACALCTAVSLFRREPHRRLAIAILIISCLVVSAFGPNLGTQPSEQLLFGHLQRVFDRRADRRANYEIDLRDQNRSRGGDGLD